MANSTKDPLAIVRAVAVGMALVIVGSIPKNIIFALNLRYFPTVPWLIVPTALYLWLYWQYCKGAWWPQSTAEGRRTSLRANPLPTRLWFWSLLAGTLAILALVLMLRGVNRLVVLPEQQFFDVSNLSLATIVSIIVVGAVAAAIVEESAFRGYMQQPIERRFGISVAILITGLMFAVAHLGLTPVLVPYYVAAAALYGVITYFTNSILPAIVLHTAGNIFSSTYLWLTGHAEWQRSRTEDELIWRTGPDQSFWLDVGFAALSTLVMIWAYARLRRAARRLGLGPSKLDR